MKTASCRSLTVPIALLALLASACPGGRSPRDEPPARGTTSPGGDTEKVLVFARGGDSVSLDPSHEDDGESLNVCFAIFDTLVQFKPGTTEVEPGLAESWTSSEDGLTWTFQLRRGVRFHDGTPMDADAVLFSLLRQHDPAHPFHAVGGSYKYWGGMDMGNIVDSIEKLDTHAVAFRLKKVEAPFLANLAMEFAAIVSPAALQAWGEDFGRHPVGTGAFKFVRWDPEQKIVLEKNADYWGGAPKLDRVIYEVVKDPNVRVIRFKSGAIHLFDNPGPNELQGVKDLPFARVLQEPGLNVAYLAMNTSHEPYDDPRVRRAVNHAVDKQRIVRDIYEGTATVAKNPLPPTGWGHHEGIEDFAHDPERARALLREAGLPDGFKTTLWYMPVPRPYMPDGKKVAEAIQLDLKAIGVEAELVTYDWAAYLEGVNAGRHDMALLGWSGDNGDPDNFLNVLLSIAATEIPAQNIAFWKDDEFDGLIRRAKETVDHAERERLYRQAQEVFHARPPWVCLAHNLQSVVVREEVEGFVLSPTTRKDFRRVSLK